MHAKTWHTLSFFMFIGLPYGACFDRDASQRSCVSGVCLNLPHVFVVFDILDFVGSHRRHPPAFPKGPALDPSSTRPSSVCYATPRFRCPSGPGVPSKLFPRVSEHVKCWYTLGHGLGANIIVSCISYVFEPGTLRQRGRCRTKSLGGPHPAST